MTQIMKTYSGYTADVTELQGGSSYLSEVSGIFLLNPSPDNSQLNIEPMIGYENEYHRPRRGTDVLNRFAYREIDPEVRREIEGTRQAMPERPFGKITVWRRFVW